MVFDDAGNLYAAGSFTVAPDGTAANYVAMWNGKAWSPLGTGINARGIRIAYSKGLLYVAGDTITLAGGVAVQYVAVWNGSTWHGLDFITNENFNNIQFTPKGDMYVSMSMVGAANLVSSAVTTVTNNGSTIAYPEIHIKRVGGTSASVQYMKNETTGATLWMDYSLLDGEELVIKTQPGNRSITSSFAGSVWRALLRESDFSAFNLMPGANVIGLFVNPVGAPTVTAWMTYKVTHWGSDLVAA
jgi:hypothetical protein